MCDKQSTGKKKHVVVAFDGEFTGPYGELFSDNGVTKQGYMNALGACVMTMEPRPRYIDRYFAALKPPNEKAGIHPFTMKTYWSKHQDLLKCFEDNARDPKEEITWFVEWLVLLMKNFEVTVVCDCIADAEYLNSYLRMFGFSPLLVFKSNIPDRDPNEDPYTGWPFITDDQYRGFLNKVPSIWDWIYRKINICKPLPPPNSLWGLDDAIKDTFGYNPEPLPVFKDKAIMKQHHPTFDAWEIASLFATFTTKKPYPVPQLMEIFRVLVVSSVIIALLSLCWPV